MPNLTPYFHMIVQGDIRDGTETVPYMVFRTGHSYEVQRIIGVFVIIPVRRILASTSTVTLTSG
jgi:hypothetical protein